MDLRRPAPSRLPSFVPLRLPAAVAVLLVAGAFAGAALLPPERAPAPGVGVVAGDGYAAAQRLGFAELAVVDGRVRLSVAGVPGAAGVHLSDLLALAGEEGRGQVVRLVRHGAPPPGVAMFMVLVKDARGFPVVSWDAAASPASAPLRVGAGDRLSADVLVVLADGAAPERLAGFALAVQRADA